MSNNDVKKIQLDAASFGIQYFCKCSINGVDFLPQNIVRLNFGEWIFDVLPRLDLILIDDGKYFEKFPIQEGDIVRVEIAKNSRNEDSLIAEFSILDWNLVPSDPNLSRNAVMSIAGVLKNNELLYPIRSKSFSKTTSDKVFASIANTAGLKFDSKIRCSDSMNWLQVNMSDLKMMDYVLNGSFKGSNDTNFCYTDRKSKMTYTSLKTELKNPVKFRMTHNPSKVVDFKDSSKQPQKSHKETKGKELFYASYKVQNFSGSNNRLISYGVDNPYWNLTQIKSAKVIDDSHALTSFSHKEKKNVGKIVSAQMQAYSSDNQHGNYQLALSQNRYIKENFFANSIFVFINANDEINLFDKVFLNIPTLDGRTDVNETQSGEYLVGGIYHEIGKDSIYKMMVALFRNGVNKSSWMKKSDFRLNDG